MQIEVKNREVDLRGFRNLKKLEVRSYKPGGTLNLRDCINLIDLNIMTNTDIVLEGLEMCMNLKNIYISINGKIFVDLRNLHDLEDLGLATSDEISVIFGSHDKLKKLYLECPKFNQPIPFIDFPNLEYLDMLSEAFDQEIDLRNSLKLETFVFSSEEFNRTLDFTSCEKIKEINIGEIFNQPLDLSQCKELRRLGLGDKFNQPLDLSQCKELISLDLGNEFNQILFLTENVNLETLTIGSGFQQNLDLSQNAQLKQYTLSRGYLGTVILPSHILNEISERERRRQTRMELERQQRLEMEQFVEEEKRKKKAAMKHLAPKSFKTWLEKSGFKDLDVQIDEETLECYDFVLLEDVQIREHVAEDASNIAIGLFDVKTKRLQQTICTTIDSLRKSALRTRNKFVPCLIPDHMGAGILETSVAIKISLANGNYFVPKLDITKAVKQANENGIRIFGLVRDESVSWPASASLSALNEQDYVSADHCQQGTEKLIYRLVPLK